MSRKRKGPTKPRRQPQKLNIADRRALIGGGARSAAFHASQRAQGRHALTPAGRAFLADMDRQMGYEA